VSLILIGGGARSGKSRYALELARQSGPRLAFLATARPEDDEMRARIGLHQQERGPEFTTLEEPLALADRINAEASHYDAIVIDCATLWLSNLLLSEADIERECSRLLQSAAAAPTRVLLVTNEVGCGIVPENALARAFRDHAGRLNQQAANAAVEVYWMIFGVPLRVK
jgi:adenosylcobinamide kinase/adenosylcobinamide-phosphate guanylyltransferase